MGSDTLETPVFNFHLFSKQGYLLVSPGKLCILSGMG
jgi:hypothetical protein